MKLQNVLESLLTAINELDEESGYPATFISGAIGENTYKTSPSQPTYTGSITIQGLPSKDVNWTKFYVSIWLNTNRSTNGQFFSFQISKADMEKEAKKEEDRLRRHSKQQQKQVKKVRDGNTEPF